MSRARTRTVVGYVAANVARIRTRQGLTQEELAERANLGLRHLQRVERGGADLGVSVLVALADALDVAPAILLRRASLGEAVRGRPRRRRRARTVPEGR